MSYSAGSDSFSSSYSYSASASASDSFSSSASASSSASTSASSDPFPSHPFDVFGTAPPVVQYILLPSSLLIAGLFFGVKHGLMGLEIASLEKEIESGTNDTQKYARRLLSLRRWGNVLLCALVLTYTLFATIFTIVSVSATDSVVAGFFLSTFLMFVAGKLVPQALFSHYTMGASYYTSPIISAFFYIFFWFAWPFGRALDYVFGEEMKTSYTRNELKTLMSIHLDQNTAVTQLESNLLSSVLDFGGKQASQVMTSIDEVFMLKSDEVLDPDLVENVVHQGYSRVLVYNKDRNDIVGLLLLKDIALSTSPSAFSPAVQTSVHPSTSPTRTHHGEHQYMTVRELLETKGKNMTSVFPDESLNQLLRKAIGGVHVLLVHDVVTEETSDPHYEIRGIVTLEDILQELLANDMVDESDVYINEKSKARLEIVKGRKGRVFRLTEHEVKGCVTFLSRTFPALFGSGVLEPSVLEKLVAQTVAEEVEEGSSLCRAGKSNHYTILFIRGKVQVENAAGTVIGERTNMDCWGVTVLNQGTQVMDVTLVATQPSLVLKLSKRAYQAAWNASVLARKEKEEEEREEEEGEEEEDD